MSKICDSIFCDIPSETQPPELVIGHGYMLLIMLMFNVRKKCIFDVYSYKVHLNGDNNFHFFFSFGVAYHRIYGPK